MRVNHLQYAPLANYSLVYGKMMEDEELAKELATLYCGIAIACLHKLFSLHVAICEGNQDAKTLYNQLRYFHSYSIMRKGGSSETYFQYGAIMCPQSLFLLEKWALIYCRMDDEIRMITIEDLCLVMDLLLVANDKLPKSDIRGHEAEYLYLMLYYNTHRPISNQIARAYYIYGTLAKKNPITTKIINEYETQKGFSIEERLSVLFNSLSIFKMQDFSIENMLTTDLCTSIDNFDAKKLNEAYRKVSKEICTTHAQMKRESKKILDQVWNFEPFYRHPFVQIGNNQYALSETSIVYQIWEGLYWSVRYSVGADDTRFLSGFGKPFEQYVQDITCKAADGTKGIVHYLGEFFYNYDGNRKASSDCYIKVDNTLFVIEVKAKSPHSNTLTGVNREAIMAEVDDLVVNPVNQALARTGELFSGNCQIEDKYNVFFSNADRLIICSVSMEKVQPVGELLYYSDKKIISTIPDIKMCAYHNLNIYDYEVVCGLLESRPKELGELLVSWFLDQRKDERSGVVLSNYLFNRNIPYNSSNYVSFLFSNTMREISERTFGYNLLS